MEHSETLTKTNIRECRLCGTDISHLRRDSTFCGANHRALHNKWKLKYLLNDEQIVLRFNQMNSDGLQKVVTKRTEPRFDLKKFKSTSSEPKPIPPKVFNKPIGMDGDVISYLKELIDIVKISQVDLVPTSYVLSKYDIGRTTLYRWVKEGLINSYSSGDKSKSFYDNNEIKRMIMDRG